MKTTGKIITTLATGLVVGAVLGLLFAPRKGTDTIKKFGDDSKKIMDEILEKLMSNKNKFFGVQDQLTQKNLEKTVPKTK